MKILFLLYLLFFLPSIGDTQTLLELNKKFVAGKTNVEDVIRFREHREVRSFNKEYNREKEGKRRSDASFLFE